MFVVLFVALISTTLLDGLLEPGPLDGWSLDIAFVLALSLAGLSLSVARFSAPKAVVAPRLRSERGLIYELRDRRADGDSTT